MATPKFSMVIIAKNEEHTLPRLLNSLRDFKDRKGEIILLDTGSTDNTIKIAQDFGCKVYSDSSGSFRGIGEEGVGKVENTWHYTVDDTVGKDNVLRLFHRRDIITDEMFNSLDSNKLFDYGAARNAAAKLSSNDFVFFPDCDEFWETLDIDTLNILLSNDPKPRQLDIRFVYKYQNGSIMSETRRDKFYDRSKASWKYRIHERVEPIKSTYVPAEVASLVHMQEHNDNRVNYLIQMCVHYLESKKDNTLGSQHQFWFAREFAINKYYWSAIRHYKACLKERDDMWIMEKAMICCYIGDIYAELKDEDKAMVWWYYADFHAGIREGLGRILKYYFNRQNKDMCMRIIDKMEKILLLKSYLTEYHWYNGSTIPEIGYWAFYSKDYNRAKMYWTQAVKADPKNKKFTDAAIHFSK